MEYLWYPSYSTPKKMELRTLLQARDDFPKKQLPSGYVNIAIENCHL